MAALAAEVPPELFERILFFLRGQWGSYELLGWAENKRELLSCTQTCWYWARYVRPALFHTITLRSLEDLTNLLSLASSSDSTLRNDSCSLMVKTLILESAIVPDPPWLHRIFLSKTALPNIANVSLSLHGFDAPPESLRRITSVHPSLPKTVPATLSRCDTVTIRDARLGHFEQLAAIVRSVYWLGPAEWLEPSCDKTIVPAFHFRNVSWNAYRPVAVCPRRHPYTAVDAEYVVEDCAEPWLFVRLFLTTRAWNDDIVAKRRVPIPYVDPGELAKLEDMLRCVTESAVGTLQDGDSAAPLKNCGKFTLQRGEVNTTKSGFTFSVTCSSRPACTPSVTTHISAAGLITKFSISFDETFSQNHSSIDLNRDCAGFAWQDLDSASLAFGDRMPLVLVRLFGDRDSVDVVAEGIAKKMPGLHEAQKLRFAWGSPERWRLL